MKIKKLSLRNFKRFVRQRDFNFCDSEGIPMETIVIVGNNGSGKSSILQAIASVVGSAVRPHFYPQDLEWPGFDYDYLQAGNLPLLAKVTVGFDNEEVEATREFARDLIRLYPERKFALPSDQNEITLSLDYEEKRTTSKSNANLFQIKGYQYALQLKRFENNPARLFEKIGGIFWYHEMRTSTSFSPIRTNGLESVGKGVFDENTLREYLVRLNRFHENIVDGRFLLREGQMDLYQRLDESFKRVFKNRSLYGPAPKKDASKQYEVEDFYFSKADEIYEMAGMSAGERAIFPLLIDFSTWSINNSIILIDELELHLHPPLQQSLVLALPELGRNNQFIITPHSDDVASLFSEEQIIRLPNE